MPDLFSPYTLKGVTLRNRIAMSPMTMYRAVDGKMSDFHVMLMGSRAAGGFGLVFPEQIAITPDGRTGIHCAGIYDDDQIEGLSRVTAIIKDMGSVPAIQLGHTGRKGSELKPWEGKLQLPPATIPMAGRCAARRRSPMAAAIPIPCMHSAWKRSTSSTAPMPGRRSVRSLPGSSGWRCIFAHGYLGASFFSPIANQRTDEYGGSLANRLRFHREALDAVRAVWPERLPLTMRLGSDDFNDAGIKFDDAVWAIGVMKDHGLDLADLSLGMNTDDIKDVPFKRRGVHGGARQPRAARGRDSRWRQLEPRAAGGRRPGDPAGTDRPGAARPPGAVQPALACLGGARTGA